MKINLINVAYPGSPVKSFPLGLASIIAHLQQTDHQVDFLDAEPDKLTTDEIFQWCLAHPADLVAINATSYTRFDAADLAVHLKREGVRWILFGGHHYTHLPVETLQHYPFVDFVVSGPAETPLQQLFDALDKGKSGNLDNIEGLTFRQNGSIKRIPRGIEKNFGEPRSLSFERFRIPDYSTYDELLFLYSERHRQSVKQGKTITFFLSRGCPYSCYFCANVKYWRKISFRKLDDAIQDIRFLQGRYDITHFIMIDPSFTINRKYTEAFCHRILQENIKLIFFCSTRVNLVDEALVDLMVEAGLQCIQFGIETGSQRIIENINKGIRLDDVRENVKMCTDRGLTVKGYFMFGHPGESEEDVMKTIRFSKDLQESSNDRFVPVSMFTDIYPGSRLEAIAKQNGRLGGDFSWFERKEYPQNHKINMGWTMVPLYENETCKIERILELGYHNFPELLNPELYKGYDRIYKDK